VSDDGTHERTFEELLEASSLGTPAAKALRAMTPPELARECVRRANAMPDDEEAADIARALDSMSAEDWADFAHLIAATEEEILAERSDEQ
jgi:hypothetical protein